MVTDVTYRFDADGGMIEMYLVLDADLIAEIFLTDPENVTIHTDTVSLGVATELFTIDDPVLGMTAVSVTYTTFTLDIADIDDATVSFDWELSIVGQSEEIVVSNQLLHVGTMSGAVSDDGMTITWEAITGTVTTVLCILDSGFPCDEFSIPAEEWYAGQPLGSWSEVTGS